MNRGFRGRGLVRACILIPWAIPTAVTAKLWGVIYDPQGILNHLLGTHIQWTSDKWPARWAIIIADTWKTTPFIALLILAGLAFLVVQLVVSIQERQQALDLSGDPWNGRTLEWLTASPPAPYNFAVLPQVRDIDAFYEMKARGVAYRRPDRYHDIYMPKNTSAGVILGVLAGLLGFAMIWYIWWVAIAVAVGMWAVIIARAYDDDAEYCLPAGEVEKIEARRYEALASAARAQTAGGRSFFPQPLPESLT